MIQPVLSTAGIIHVSLCQIKTVYMIPKFRSTAGIIHVSLEQMETAYVIPPVIPTAGIIHLRFLPKDYGLYDNIRTIHSR